MARDTSEVLRGPFQFLVAPVATAFPANPSATATGFEDLGYSDQGANLTESVTNEPIRVEEEIRPIAFDITQRDTTIEIMLSQMSLANFVVVFGGSITADAGPPATNSWAVPTGTATVQKAILLRGSGPGDQSYGVARDIQIPVATSLGGFELVGRKGQKQGIAVQFGIALPSGGASPYTFVDLDLSSS